MLEIISFVVPCWIVNIGLNLFYYFKCKYGVEDKIDAPLDFGKKFSNGTRILGGSTTLLGFPVALVLGSVGGFVVGNLIFIGLLKGLTVYFGHATGSFIKRRFRFERGKFMPVVDHGDYVVMTSVVFLALNLVSINVVIFSVLFTYILHPLTCFAAYKLGLRKDPL